MPRLASHISLMQSQLTQSLVKTLRSLNHVVHDIHAIGHLGMNIFRHSGPVFVTYHDAA